MFQRVALALVAVTTGFIPASAVNADARTLRGIVRPAITAVHDEPCPGFEVPYPCTLVAARTIYMPWRDRFDWQHELGHLYDDQFLDDDERAVLMRLMRLAPPWDQGTGDSAYGKSASELFADGYAACRLNLDPYGERREWASAYGWWPSLRQHRRVCSAIRKFGPATQHAA